MAAKTQVNLSTLWNAVLETVNLFDFEIVWSDETVVGWPPPLPGDQYHGTIPFYLLTLSAAGCSCTLTGSAAVTWYDPVTSAPGPPPYPGLSWYGAWEGVQITVTWPGGSWSKWFMLWIEDGWGKIVTYIPDPSVYTWIDDASELQVPVEIALTGIYLKSSTDESPPSDRGFMHFTDRTQDNIWYADEDAEVTITATTPDGDQGGTGAFSDSGEIEAHSLLLGTVYLETRGFTNGDMTYMRVSDMQWGTHAIQAVKDLYNPGSGTAPDTTYNPDWKRTGSAGTDWRITPDGTIGLQAEAAAGGVSYTWMVTPPRTVTFKPSTGEFDDDQEADPAIEVEGSPLQWSEDDPPVSSSLPFTGTLTVHEDSQDLSRFNYEKQLLPGLDPLYLQVTDDWRSTNEEAVGDAEDNQDDKRCALLAHPLDSYMVDDPRTEWGTFFTITPEGNLSVVKPSGVTRPANWVGSGGLTTGGDNDVWTVAAGSSSPKATLTLAERYTSRMERHFDHAEDGYTYHNEAALYYNRANPPTAIEDLIDPPAYRVPENIWHWRNRSAGRLDITAPRAGTVIVTVRYKWPEYDFPFYTSGGANWGAESPSTLSWHYGLCTWNVPVVIGANTVAFDLAVPAIGNLDPCLHVVTSIELTLPENDGESPEQWTFSEITLLANDPAAAAQQEGETGAVIFQMYDPYNWLTDYTGFRGILCGRRLLNIPTGQDGQVGIEASLMIRQKRRHDPDSEAEGILDYAKTADTTSTEINSQEGLETSYADPHESAHNKDEDGEYLFNGFRTFDLLHAHQWEGETGAIAVTGSPKVASIVVPYGFTGLTGDDDDEGYVIYYDKYPQGRYRGLAILENRSDRQRRTGSLYLWKRPSGGGAWQLASATPVTPDRFGAWRLGPDKELNWEYGVSDSNTTSPESSYPFRNREYVWETTEEGGVSGACCFHQIPNFLYIFYALSGEVGLKHIYSAPPDWWFSNQTRTQAHYDLPKTDTSEYDSCPSGYVDTNGRIRLYFLRGGAVYRGTSQNWGYTWGAGDPVATAITSADAAFQWLSQDRTRQFSVSVQSGSLIFSYSRDHFTTIDGSSTVTTGVDTAQVSGYDYAGQVTVFCFKSGALYAYKMLANGVWSEVT